EAHGGTTWVVAGRWLGAADRGILALRRVRLLDAVPRGRGALRDRLSARAATLFGARAPLVEALVPGRRAELDAAVRVRYVAAVGAWLSVAAIAAVIWAARATTTKPKLIRLLAPSAAATLITAPITAYAFGTVAPIGIVANLIAIPLAAIAVPGLMIALVLS